MGLTLCFQVLEETSESGADKIFLFILNPSRLDIPTYLCHTVRETRLVCRPAKEGLVLLPACFIPVGGFVRYSIPGI